MSVTDYVVDLLLVALVLRQIRPRVLSAKSLLLPLALVAVAGILYLKSFPTGGNDVLMDVVLAAAGVVFGAVSGLATHVYRLGAHVVARAGVVAAVVWVLGMGIRFGFDVWANTHSGEAKLVHFSMQHSITSAQAYVTAFVLMAFAQVLVRIGILQIRRWRIEQGHGAAVVSGASRQ